MSLVAYESSDESSENEQNESEEALAENNANNDASKTIIVQTNVKLSLPAPKTVSQERNDEEVENVESGRFKHFLDLLPKPKVQNSAQIVEEDDDIVTKKEIKNQTVKPVRKQIVKISVPSLLEFKDLEEDKERENEKKPAKVIQPSQKGCGLFTVLVPPKEGTTNNKSLVPQAVRNTSLKPSVQQPKTVKKSSTSPNDSKINSPMTSGKTHSELSSDDEDDEDVDFFGLTASKSVSDTSDSSVTELSLHRLSTEEASLVDHTDHTTQNSPNSSDIFKDSTSKTLISNVINLPKEEILLKNKAEVGPKLPVPEQEYNIDTEGNVAFDEKAIEYLCGKRGVKRKAIDEANIIEISGEDIKPDEREWLVKALTEEPIHRPISMQSCGINSQSKKKHQITYLAHQAKAMELELKNQWSQNRMTRKQTQSKYGF